VLATACGSTLAVRTNVPRADVFSVGADGAKLRNLTRTPRAWESQVSVSPDGSRVAFVRSARADRGGRLLVVDAAGHGARELGPAALSPDPTAPPAWSPDGRAIAFTNAVRCDEVICKTWEVWVVDVATGHRRRVTRRGMSPTWSPDGHRLAYAGNLVTGFTGRGYFTFSTDIVVADLRTGRTRTLGRGRAPVWAPASDWIAYFTDARERLRLVHSDGSGARGVSTYSAAPQWTPDGRLLFVRSPPDSDVATVVVYSPRAGRRRARLLVRDADGGFAASGDGRRLAWARFVYLRDEARSHDDLLVGRVGRRRGRVVVTGDPGAMIGTLAWGHGRRIVFSAGRVS
jgi:Tol biopolymer transport system component